MTVPTTQDHGLTPADFPETARLTPAAIDAAVETIRRFAGWHIWPERNETVSLFVPGDQMVLLPTKRLVAVDSVTIDGVEVPITDDDWTPDGQLWVDSLTPTCSGRPRRVVASITHGYTGPGDIIQLVGSMAARASRPSESYTVGRISVGAPGSITPQSTEWRIIDELRLGPEP